MADNYNKTSFESQSQSKIAKIMLFPPNFAYFISTKNKNSISGGCILLSTFENIRDSRGTTYNQLYGRQAMFICEKWSK